MADKYIVMTKEQYIAEIKTTGGVNVIMVGSLEQCVAAINEMGEKVKKAKIKAVE